MAIVAFNVLLKPVMLQTFYNVKGLKRLHIGLSPVQPGSAISDWREIKSSLDLVINFKFVSFATNQCNYTACMRPLLELTTQLRFRPVGCMLQLFLAE